jgi:hypothetical protein
VSAARLTALIAGTLLVALLGAGVLAARFSLSETGDAVGTRIYSTWVRGRVTAHEVVPPGGEAPKLRCGRGCTRAAEEIVAQAPLWTAHRALAALSIVPRQDGLRAELDGKVAYATPDELIAWGAAAGRTRFGAANIKAGLGGIDRALKGLADRLGTDPDTLFAEGRFHRVVFESAEGDKRRPWIEAVPPEQVDIAAIRKAVMSAARYLARHVRKDGSFNYEVVVTTGKTRTGRSFPRHGGATLFLAEAAAYSGDLQIRNAAIRAADYLLKASTQRCGEHDCVGVGRSVNIGSSGVALLAYTELVRHGLDDRFKPAIARLAAFLRSQQRPDGEFMHVFDRKTNRPVDVQLQYYTGESMLALARAYQVTQNPEDIQAASRALEYATGKGWDFFGSRYFFANEHWTCQAIDDIWDHAPSEQALDFCLRYNAFSRLIQQDDGGYNLNPVHIPRSSETGSRTEAAAATLNTAARAGVDPAEIAALEGQLFRGIGYLIGMQMNPGPTHLMSHPSRVRGGLPGDAVDMTVRIDFAQHAGSGMLRFLRYLEARDDRG